MITKNRHVGLLLFFLLASAVVGYGQKVLIKNNLLYDFTTTPNLGLEVRLSQQTSLSLHGSYNPFELPGEVITDTAGEEIGTNTKLMHWSVMPEFKYWFCDTFEGGYLGLHGIYSQYNIGGIPYVPFLENHRYQGVAYGGGLSYGYQWALGSRWGLEFSLGGGFLHLEYDKYDVGECGDHLGKFKRDYWGVTKVALSIVYFIR